MKPFTVALLAASLLSAHPALAADSFARQRLEWNKPMAPFHVIGPIYYVGMADVSAFLIDTPQGLILTDGGLPESAPQIEAHIKALGFKLSDVHILLNSHAHFDHAGGLAALKRDTHAQFYASAADKPFLESGRITFGPSAVPEDDFPPVKVDHVVADGDTVTLGGITLTAHLTPGHTPGCTSWSMPVRDGNTTLSALFFCSITTGGNPLVDNKPYPAIAADFKASFARLKTMPVDILLAAHGDQMHLDAKLAALNAKTPGAPNPFVDPKEFPVLIARMEKSFNAELAKQAAGNRP
jgi:metallo-beta-lactamase class B